MGRDGVRLGSVVLQTVLLAVLGLGLGIGLPSRALAAPYRWIDDQGTVHYSQRLDEVPERYRTGTSQLAAATTPADGRSLVAQSSSGLSSTVNPLQMPTGGWLGISLADQPAGPNAPPGVLISDVLPSGPGDRAGFRTGDLLVAIGTIQLQEILAEAQGARVPGSTFVLGALRRLAPGTRLKFDVMRGQERSTLFFFNGTATTEQTLLFGKRERATQQLQQIAVVEQWLAANVSANDLARATASIGPLYRDQNLLLRDIMSTAGESTLRSKLLEAKQDRRLEVLHRLIGVLQTVETRSLPVCCGQADHYREFSRTLQGLLPPKYYFKKTVDSASPFTLGAIRSTLLFIEPYQDAHERLQDVESRLKVSEAALAVNTEFAAVQSQLQANADRGVFRDATLDVRIARLPDSMRTSLRDYEKQLVATAEQRKRDADAAEAERRKQKETMDAGFEQLKGLEAA